MGTPTSLVARSLDDEETADAFEARVAAQAELLREAIRSGELDNEGFAVGLEMEVYAVEGMPTDNPGSGDEVDDAGWRGALARLPEAVFDAGATKELGLHNAEINTDPDVCSGEGLANQAASIEADFEAAQRAARAKDRELVLDAMWTIPPAEGSRAYLSDHDVEDGFVHASNMRPDPRYFAIDNDVVRRVDGAIPFAVPGVDTTFPSILFESLATSIQPHLQIPTAEAFPAYYNAGIRTLGPLLALATNSPFLPADLYEDNDGAQGDAVADPHDLVDATHHELRIAVFEQSVNQSPHPKVRVPRDIEAATDVVDRVVEDDRYAPFLREWIEDGAEEDIPSHEGISLEGNESGDVDGPIADQVWEFDYRRTTYWRWLRCVVGGDPVAGAGDENSLRIEYRPLPTQPTVRDVVGLQAATAGLLRGLVAADHPLTELPWEAAEESFYAAAEDGLDADLAWVTADGERTNESDVIFDEVLEFAHRGLAESGVDRADAEYYLDPIQARIDAGLTPSMWKKARVREGLDDGLDLQSAIERMQREYIRRSRETGSFAEWL